VRGVGWGALVREHLSCAHVVQMLSDPILSQHPVLQVCGGMARDRGGQGTQGVGPRVGGARMVVAAGGARSEGGPIWRPPDLADLAWKRAWWKEYGEGGGPVATPL